MVPILAILWNHLSHFHKLYQSPPPEAGYWCRLGPVGTAIFFKALLRDVNVKLRLRIMT